MKYSLRTLLVAVACCAALLVLWLWYCSLPPVGSGSWHNHIGHAASNAPRFYFGGFEANSEHFAGYLVRVDDPEIELPAKEWLETDDGCLFISGNRILPRSRYHLFISSNDGTPRHVLLAPEDALKFRTMPYDIANWEQFWQTVHGGNGN